MDSFEFGENIVIFVNPCMYVNSVNVATYWLNISKMIPDDLITAHTYLFMTMIKLYNECVPLI